MAFKATGVLLDNSFQGTFFVVAGELLRRRVFVPIVISKLAMRSEQLWRAALRASAAIRIGDIFRIQTTSPVKVRIVYSRLRHLVSG
jgi:hypothetical protein